MTLWHSAHCPHNLHPRPQTPGPLYLLSLFLIWAGWAFVIFPMCRLLGSRWWKAKYVYIGSVNEPFLARVGFNIVFFLLFNVSSHKFLKGCDVELCNDVHIPWTLNACIYNWLTIIKNLFDRNLFHSSSQKASKFPIKIDRMYIWCSH